MGWVVPPILRKGAFRCKRCFTQILKEPYFLSLISPSRRQPAALAERLDAQQGGGDFLVDALVGELGVPHQAGALEPLHGGAVLVEFFRDGVAEAGQAAMRA